MYVLKIVGEDGVISYQTIGNYCKLYDKFEDAQKEIEVLEEIEEGLFGDITCEYIVEVDNEQKNISKYDKAS